MPLVFWFDLFLVDMAAEIQKYFCLIFGSNENFEICFRDLLTYISRYKGVWNCAIILGDLVPLPFLPRKTNLKIRNIKNLASILFIPIFGIIMNEKLLLFKPEITFTALWKKIRLGTYLHKDNSSKALMKSPLLCTHYIFFLFSIPVFNS